MPPFPQLVKMQKTSYFPELFIARLAERDLLATLEEKLKDAPLTEKRAIQRQIVAVTKDIKRLNIALGDRNLPKKQPTLN